MQCMCCILLHRPWRGQYSSQSIGKGLRAVILEIHAKIPWPSPNTLQPNSTTVSLDSCFPGRYLHHTANSIPDPVLPRRLSAIDTSWHPKGQLHMLTVPWTPYPLHRPWSTSASSTQKKKDCSGSGPPVNQLPWSRYRFFLLFLR